MGAFGTRFAEAGLAFLANDHQPALQVSSSLETWSFEVSVGYELFPALVAITRS